MTLGNKRLPVEALVLPTLGLDIMLLDSSIMQAFGAKTCLDSANIIVH